MAVAVPTVETNRLASEGAANDDVAGVEPLVVIGGPDAQLGWAGVELEHRPVEVVTDFDVAGVRRRAEPESGVIGADAHGLGPVGGD